MRIKVLRLVDGRLISPFNGYDYGKLEDVKIGRASCRERVSDVV